MGMSEEEFYDTTPRYFISRLKGWQKEVERQENWHKWHLALHRRFYSALYNIQLGKLDRKDEKNYFPFPWDEKREAPKIEDVKKWIKENNLDEIPIENF